jgi:hypothetical protein
MLTKEIRDEKAALRARLRELEDPAREARKIEEAKRRADRERGRTLRVTHQRAKPKGGRETDPAFMSWQHDSGLTCIACEMLGAPSAAQLQGERNPIEVAHQRVDGWKKGVRGHDRNSCPLCRWHHQLAPNACDKGQKAFWERLGIDAADYCAALFHAFRAGFDGREVIRRFIPSRRTS